jgi:hypothetical protein
MDELKKQEKTVSDLICIINVLENTVAQIEEENIDIKNVVTDHENRIGILEQENDYIENILANFVAFQEEFAEYVNVRADQVKKVQIHKRSRQRLFLFGTLLGFVAAALTLSDNKMRELF